MIEERKIHKHLSFEEKPKEVNVVYPSIEIDYEMMLKQKTLEIMGLEIQFPFNPYPGQIEYMEGVIESLEGKHDALLESPTGTGKTLWLLASTLSWLRRQRSDKTSKERNRIIYTSRTHSQLKQVVKELNKLCYRPKMAIVGSRDHFWINKKLDNLSGRAKNQRWQDLTHPPKNQVLLESCQYYRNNMAQFSKTSIEISKLKKVWDIEELMEIGKIHRECPYFTSRTLLEEADLIFMPYNYVTNKYIRRLYNKYFMNSVLIFDEAHNIEDRMEDGSSVLITLGQIQKALKEIYKMIDHNSGLETKYTYKVPGQNTKVKVTRDEAIFAGKVLQYISDKLSWFAINHDNNAQPNRSQWQNKGTNNDNFVLKDPIYLFELFFDDKMSDDNFSQEQVDNYESKKQEIKNINFDFDADYIALDDSISAGEEEKENDSKIQFLGSRFNKEELRAILRINETKSFIKLSRENFLNFQKIIQNIDVIIEKNRSIYDIKTGGDYIHKFVPFLDLMEKIYWDFIRTLARKENIQKSKVYSNYKVAFQRQNTEAQDFEISFWWINPGLNFQSLEKYNPVWRILTSGTLSPMDAIETELDIEFKVKLKWSHIIDTKNQVLFHIAKNSKGGKLLNFKQANSGEKGLMLDVGCSIIQLARVVPEGMLIFFTSYSIRDKYIYAWKLHSEDSKIVPQSGGGSIFQKLSQIKTICIEDQKNTNEHRKQVEKFNNSYKKGAFFFGVWGGKLSEGFDFSDGMARWVLVIGIPYSNWGNIKTQAKIAYLDAKIKLNKGEVSLRKNASSEKKSEINGYKWYELKAMRLLNQAIGRIIRHNLDYGAIILFEERMAQPSKQKKISGWLQEVVLVKNNFEDIIKPLEEHLKFDRTTALTLYNKITPQLDITVTPSLNKILIPSEIVQEPIKIAKEITLKNNVSMSNWMKISVPIKPNEEKDDIRKKSVKNVSKNKQNLQKNSTSPSLPISNNNNDNWLLGKRKVGNDEIRKSLETAPEGEVGWNEKKKECKESEVKEEIDES